MIKINKDACIGCGLCAKDCVARNVKIEEGKAKIKRECILCGHCVAICPKHAVTITEYEQDPVLEYCRETFKLNPEHVRNAAKFRRSIRLYKEQKVETEKLMQLVDIAAHTATAKNSQALRFVVVQEELEAFKGMIFDGIGKELKRLGENQKDRWTLQMHSFYRGRTREPKDEYLFRNAPAALYILGENEWDAGLAAQNIETLANALGLGVLYDGFLKYVTGYSKEAMEFLGAGEKPVAACLLLGYPDVTYQRTAPRKEADFALL